MRKGIEIQDLRPGSGPTVERGQSVTAPGQERTTGYTQQPVESGQFDPWQTEQMRNEE